VQPYNMLFNPTTTLLGIAQPVFLSAASRMTDNMPRVVSRYLGLVALTTLFMLPVFAALAVSAETVVLAVFGVKWRDSVPVFTGLALVMPMYVLWGMTTPLLWLGGDRFREFKAQWPLLLLWITIAWYAAQVSITAVAWSTLVLFALRFLVIAIAATRLVPLYMGDLLRAMRGGIVVTVGVSVMIGLIEMTLVRWELAPIARLLICLPAAVVGVIAAVLLHPRFVADEAAELLIDVTRGVSPRLSGYLSAQFGDGQRQSSADT